MGFGGGGGLGVLGASCCGMLGIFPIKGDAVMQAFVHPISSKNHADDT